MRGCQLDFVRIIKVGEAAFDSLSQRLHGLSLNKGKSLASSWRVMGKKAE